jgi:hypothetical protein
MLFLNPFYDYTQFSTGFEVRFEGIAVEAFISTTVGCVLAVVSCLIPTPIWATDDMKEHAVELQKLFDQALNASCAWFDAREKQPHQRDVLIAAMRKIRATSSRLESLSAITWWECFGYGRTQRVRTLLTRFDTRIKGCFDRLEIVFLSCSEEDFDDSHNKLMARLDMTLAEVTRIAGEMFKFGVEVANKGGLDEESAKEAVALREQANKAVSDLTKTFKEGVQQVGSAQDAIVWDLVDEHSVCACACGYVLLAREFLDDLLKFKDGDRLNYSSETIS